MVEVRESSHETVEIGELFSGPVHVLESSLSFGASGPHEGTEVG